MNGRDIKLVDWSDVRASVQQYNKELADIIDEISPTSSFKLVKATYHFGDLIVKDGILQIPTENGKLSPITNSSANKRISEILSYSPIPLSLLLNKASEVFVTENTRTVPLNMFEPGKLFGTFETLNYIFNKPSNSIWNVSAGARSIVMLPKISESSGLKRLKNSFSLFSGATLKTLSDHWYVFKDIINHPGFSQQWASEVLFFPRNWLVSTDQRFYKFQHYIFKQGWLQSQHTTFDKIKFNFWQSFIKSVTKRNLKPSPYLADTLKHILSIAAGNLPAFRPADNSQLCIPTSGLQKIFTEVYLLKEYLPTIMYPSLISNNMTMGYYSLAYPTLLEGSPENKSSSTIMLDLKDTKLMIDTLLRDIKLENNPISHVDFEYFHVEDDKFKEIKSSKKIIIDDARFLQDVKTYPDRSFCHTSQFWRGCIRISLQDKEKL